MAVLFFVISILGLWEFYSLLEKNGYAPQKYYGILLGIATFIGIGFLKLSESSEYISLLVFLTFSLFIIELFRKKETPFTNLAITLVGVIYVILPFAMLLCMSVGIHAGEIIALLFSTFSENVAEKPDLYKYTILGFFFLIWSNDTFAYLVGKAIGRAKLFERISPKKTWEGTIGGALCTQGIAYVISIYFTELASVHWHVVALIVSVFGTLGDLVESMFKRSLGVKDSGVILPGHGGILDRFDGVLLAAPFVVAYLMLAR
jgi:phosphatidate cytidylyltransferase